MGNARPAVLRRGPAVAAVVLAAGGSTRMGRSKPLLPLDGGTYLGAVLGTLARGPVGPVVVVLGAEGERVRREVDLGTAVVVHNPEWRRGMLRSLQVGIDALQRIAPSARGLLMCLVDTPRFSAATVTALVAAFLRTGAPVVQPAFEGRHGHPVLLSRQLWPELLRASGERGPREVVDAHRDGALEVDVADPWVLRDADTPEEHEALRRGD